MCVKLPPGGLNLDPYPSHSTSTYTCGVTIAPREYGGEILFYFFENHLTSEIEFLKVLKLLVLKYLWINFSRENQHQCKCYLPKKL